MGLRSGDLKGGRKAVARGLGMFLEVLLRLFFYDRKDT